MKGIEHALGKVDPTHGTAQIFIPHEVARHPVRHREDEGVFKTVSLSDVERAWRLRPRCNYRGVGPFTTHGVVHDGDRYSALVGVPQSQPEYSVFLEYAGTDDAAAAALPGFEVRGPFDSLGAGIGGKVPLSEITDYTESTTEIPVPGRKKDPQ